MLIPTWRKNVDMCKLIHGKNYAKKDNIHNNKNMYMYMYGYTDDSNYTNNSFKLDVHFTVYGYNL
jgi:restriction endonuclease S subunit